MIVRAATEGDIDAMARVHWLSSNTAYGRNDDFGRRLRQARDAFQLDYVRIVLAEEDGQVIAICNIGPDELYALYVHPDRWGDGTGQALLDEAHRLLAATCEEARLTVLADNPRARRFYERNGWELVDQLIESHFGGEPTEVCRYRRVFRRE